MTTSPRSPSAFHRELLPPTAILIAAALGCADAGQADECGPVPADVRVMLATDPERWIDLPSLEEVWRAGGTFDDQPIGLVAGLAVARDGRAAIADFLLGEVNLIAPDGRWLGAALPRGPGPGEVLAPIALAWDETNRLSVWDVEAGSVVTWAIQQDVVQTHLVNDEFNAEILMSGEVLWSAVQADGTLLTVRRRSIGRSSAGHLLEREALLSIGPDAAVPDTIVVDTVEAVSGWFRGGLTGLVAASSADGSLAYADTSGEYRVHLIAPDGERRLLCRHVEPEAVTSAERGEGAPPEWRNLAGELAAAGPVDTPNAIGRLFFDADGRLWVQRERPDPFGGTDRLHGVPGALHDVYSPDGRFLGEIKAPPGSRLQSARGNTVWGLEMGDLDETWVVAYTILEN